MLVGEELSCATDFTRVLGPAILYVMWLDTGASSFLRFSHPENGLRSFIRKHRYANTDRITGD